MTNYGYTGWQNRSGYKQKIRERDNYTCQLCGKPGHDVDHIIPWHISHDNSPSNLRVLCHNCNVSLRRKAPPKTIPFDQYEVYLRQELAKC